MPDKKITQLDALASVSADDVFLVVDNPGGTPTSKKVTAANLATYTSTGLATLASPTFTGAPTAPTAAVDTNTTQVATTAYVVGQGYAKLASPALTGTPTAPTAAAGTSNTQIATTAFADPQNDQYVLSATIFTS